MSDNGEAETPVPARPARLSESELKEFVLAAVDRRLITAHHVPQDLIGQVFMPVIFGILEGWTPEEQANLGTIYEYYSEAGPVAVNGYPTFMSCRLLSKADWEIALPSIRLEEARRQNISLVEP